MAGARWFGGLAVVVVLVGVAGCGRPAPAGHVAAGPVAAGPAAAALTRASEADNGRTVTLRTGDRLVVTLHSTYWSLAARSGSVALAGRPAVQAAAGCLPGSGCGTVTATFVARGPGRTLVVGARTSCGEALRCTGKQGRYQLTVVVR